MTSTPVGMRCPECSRQTTKVRTISSITSGGYELTKWIIGICAVVYLLTGFLNPVLSDGRSLFDALAISRPGVRSGDVWQLVTAGFLHGGLIHIGLNMLILFQLGQLIEPRKGPVKFGLIYGVSLLGGAAGALLFTTSTPTVGASGAIFGLMAYAFVDAKLNGDNFISSQIGGLLLINLLLTFALANTFSISIGGHLGGMLFGGLAAFAIVYSERARSKAIMYSLCGLLAVVAIAASLLISTSSSPLI